MSIRTTFSLLVFVCVVDLIIAQNTCPDFTASLCDEERCLVRIKDENNCTTCQCDNSGDVLYGDMRLTEETKPIADREFNTDIYKKKQAFGSDDIQSGAAKAGTIRLWNNIPDVNGHFIIPYLIHSTITATMRPLIDAAIADYENLTCMKFRPYQGEPNYIRFSNFDEAGCWSYLGRRSPTGDKVNDIQLHYNDCGNKGVVLHEILHALGFWHEQARPDRDSYVKIHENNILAGYESQFYKKTTDQIDSLGVPYAIDSIMHYYSTIFSNSNAPGVYTITDLVDQELVTQQAYLAESDLLQLQRMYNYNCAEITTPAPTESTPSPTKPTPGPTETTPDPIEPTPGPTETTPGPTESTPGPTESTPGPTEPTTSPSCQDTSSKCQRHKDRGHCVDRKALMREKCQATCGFCGVEPTTSPSCEDTSSKCQRHKDRGHCVDRKAIMREKCQATCGFCGVEPTISPSCEDNWHNCQEHKDRGHCVYRFMREKCQATCGFCGVEGGGCRDTFSSIKCATLNSHRQCYRVYESCFATCGLCGPSCVDKHRFCRKSTCRTKYGFYLCKKTCGYCQ